MTLRDARKAKKFSQTELASIVGCSQAALSLIENYKAFPRGQTRKRLQKVLGEIEFYPAGVLVGMIERFIGSDPTVGRQRGKFLKQHIDKVIECIILNIRNFKTK